MSNWTQDFPLLADHVGVWEGEYVHLDPDGREVDRHASHLRCWMPDDGSYDIIQVNTYTWPDGRSEAVEFAGRLRVGTSTSTTNASPGTCTRLTTARSC